MQVKNIEMLNKKKFQNLMNQNSKNYLKNVYLFLLYKIT